MPHGIPVSYFILSALQSCDAELMTYKEIKVQSALVLSLPYCLA